MIKSTAKKVIVCICAGLFIGAVLMSHADEKQGKVLKVPFIKQEGRYECAVAALMSLLKWNDIPLNYEEVKKGIYSESAKGTFPVSVELFLRKHELSYQTLKGDLDMLEHLIKENVPSMALLKGKAGFITINHYYVVVGIKGDELIVHDGSNAFKKMSSRKFMKKWKESSYWLLYLEKKVDD